MAKKNAAKAAPLESETPAAQVQPNERTDDAPPETPARPAYTGRASIIRELADRNRDKRDDDLRDEGIEPVDTRGPKPAAIPGEDEDEAARRRDDESDAPPAGSDTTPPAGAAPGADDEPPVVEPPAAQQRRKFTIDGQIVELTDEEITAYVQKGKTADQRLAEATRLLEGAQRTVPSAATRENPSASPQPSGTSPDAVIPPSDQDVEALAKTLMYGKEEDVTAALKRVIGGGRQGSVEMAQRMATQTQGMSAEEVTEHVRTEVAKESARLSFESYAKVFDLPPDKGGYADIWSDPVLKAEFMRREDLIRDAGDKRPYGEVHTQIATELRTWRDGLASKHSTKTGLEDRDTRKRGTGVVRGAGGTPPPAQQESRPQTHEEKLDRLRAARGQK